MMASYPFYNIFRADLYSRCLINHWRNLEG
jgi:hypothetical protein